MKNLIRKILKESNDEKFINYMISRLKRPYFKNLKKFGISKDEEYDILSKIFDQPITIEYTHIFNSDNNLLYTERDNGKWSEYKYNKDGKIESYIDFKDVQIKYQYDNNGKVTKIKI